MLRQCGSTALLERVISTAQLLGFPLCWATSTDQEDSCLVAAADNTGILAFRSSLNNVLGRASEPAQFAKFDALQDSVVIDRFLLCRI